MTRFSILFTLCTILLTIQLNAQEICNNSIDDDGDGLIDCFDKDCSFNQNCEDFFLGNTKCSEIPNVFSPFTMKLKFKSAAGTANHVSRVIAGDIDSDGKPELLTTYGRFFNGAVVESKLNVFNAPNSGTDLQLTKSMGVLMSSTEGASYDDIAMADINSDGCAEIFVITMHLNNISNYKISAYDCNGTQIWTNPISLTFNPGMIGLADFDHDGLVELYSRTQIYDAHTGQLLGENNIDNVDTGINAGVNRGYGMNSNAPIAIDILPNNPGLELVAGCRIYGVTINRANMTALLPMLREYPQYATRTLRSTGSTTSVADFNQDGFLDVLASGSLGAYDANTTIFFWDVKNNVVKTFSDAFGTTDYKFGWKNGTGRINIADVDGDTLMNAVYVSGKFLYALKEGAANLEVLWKEPVVEETSGYTGCTTFDANGDGRAEIFYRDENNFYVYQTDASGVVTKNTPIRCASRTHYEYPVVVDMDGDGSAEVCVTCSSNDLADGMAQMMTDPGEIRVYESANEPWMSARKVWNQHGYFVTNVNDDLTIPRVQQNHHFIYARNAPCRKDGTSRPLNSFLNQSTNYDESGCPVFSTPNLMIVPFNTGETINYSSFNCLADSFQVSFHYVNTGSVSVNSPLKISFYDGDPTLASPPATLLHTETVWALDMNPGDTITTTLKLKNPDKDFDLFVVLNDDGTTIPLNLSSQSGHILECEEGNIANVRIERGPVALDTKVLQLNQRCLNPPGIPATSNNGALKAAIWIDEDELDHTNFNFYWSNGPVPKPIAAVDFVGPEYINLDGGVYTVYAIHKTLTCASDTISIEVSESVSSIDAEIVVDHAFDDPINPNGALSVIAGDVDNDGTADPQENFTYTWYDGKDIVVGDVLGTSHALTGLDDGIYSVLVLSKINGCYDSVSVIIPNAVMGSEEDAMVKGVSMYPNPGTNEFTVSIDNRYIGEVKLQVESSLGNEVHSIQARAKTTRKLEFPVDTHKLKSGVYLIKISLGKEILYLKWIKV